MKQKEVILWVVAIGALCLSFLAIFGPKLQGVKSQASNRNTLQLQSTTVGTFTDATGTACIKAANKELNDCKKEFVIGDDGITQVDRCNVQYAQSLVECAKLFTPATNDN